MDIEAISGPKTAGNARPVFRGEDPDQVDRITPVILFSLDIRDRVTISPEARRKYEERRRNKHDGERDAAENA